MLTVPGVRVMQALGEKGSPVLSHVDGERALAAPVVRQTSGGVGRVAGALVVLKTQDATAGQSGKTL